MSDFVIRAKDGWEELDDFHSAVSEGNLRGLWEGSASGGDMGAIQDLLAEIGYELEDEELIGFRIIATADDIHGDYYRAWVKTK
jgi:hypothetical protein